MRVAGLAPGDDPFAECGCPAAAITLCSLYDASTTIYAKHYHTLNQATIRRTPLRCVHTLGLIKTLAPATDV
ncbi:hypothetical protein M3J09_010517 [Ascochyta lentis]